jgi:O-antigen/teichoic acid export membrane protein
MQIRTLKTGEIGAMQLFQLIRFATLFLISIVLSKSGLSKSEIGLYEIFIFLSGLISYFWVTGLVNSFLSVFQKTEYRKDNPALFNGAIVMTGFSLLAAISILIAAGPVKIQLGGESDNQILLMLILYTFLSGPSSLVENFYLLNRKPGRIISFGILTFLIQLVVVSAPVLAGYQVIYALAGLNFATLFRFIWLWVIVFRNSKIKLSPEFIRLHLKTAWPLIVGALIGGSTTFIDGFVVTALYDNEVFAIFRYGARELPLVVLLANAFSNAMVPAVAQSKDLTLVLKEIKQKSTRLAHFLYPVSMVLLLVSYWLFPIIFNPEFRESAGVFNIYLLIITSRLMFPQTILYGLRRNKETMIVAFLTLIVHIGFSIGLANLAGIQGVAMAAVLANIFEKLTLASVLRKKEGIRLIQYLDIKWWIIYNMATIAVFSIVTWMFM